MGLRPGLVWIISLILCTPSVPSSTGMWERVWRRESFPRPVRISLPWRRITRRSELTPSREKERRRERNIKLLTLNPKTLNQLLTELDHIIYYLISKYHPVIISLVLAIGDINVLKLK